jgi:hypothetical protein
MAPDLTASHVAAIMNAAYLVRHYRRPVTRTQRTLAIQDMANALRAALRTASNAEALLYAVAVGLYDPGDRRFHV